MSNSYRFYPANKGAITETFLWAKDGSFN